MASHKFYEADAARNAARLSVRAVEHARGFVNGAEKSERARDEAFGPLASNAHFWSWPPKGCHERRFFSRLSLKGLQVLKEIVAK